MTSPRGGTVNADANEDTPYSDKWWFKQLSKKLDADRARMEDLDRYFNNDPPTYDSLLGMKAIDDPSREVLSDFLRRSRSGFAELVVESVREKMIMRAWRTSLDNDQTGDKDAWGMWKRSGMPVISTDVHQWMLTMGRSYVAVGEKDPETNSPIVTAEDPRQMITYSDPARPQHVLAALKMFTDELLGDDFAVLSLPGRRKVWRRDSSGGMTNVDNTNNVLFGNGDQWKPDNDLSKNTGMDWVNVTPFVNRGGKGEFENQTSILDRINFMVLQRLMIAAVQAFKQRALIGAPLVYPDDYPDTTLRGKTIDYTKMFYSAPDAFWLVPRDSEGNTMEIWESTATDLRPMLDACRDDLMNLSAISKTPLHYLNPDSANQTAEGANLIREGYNARISDRIGRVESPWTRVYGQMSQIMGGTNKSSLDQISPLWESPVQYSLTDKAQATAALYGKVPFPTLMTDIMQFAPEHVDRLVAEREDEMLIMATVEMAAKAAAQPPQPKKESNNVRTS